MKELDLLKKDWNKSNNAFEQLSETEIYEMLHKKSSSIVKWILGVSIIEFVFWIVISILLSDDKYQVKLHNYGIEDFVNATNIFNYLIILVFIFVFYKNYRNISTTDSTRQLMKNILKTRRTVRNYIWYNLATVVLSIVVSIVMLFKHNKELISMMDDAATKGHEALFITISVALSILFIALIIGVFWMFYKLLYGILLKKLNANYTELKKIEL